MFPGGFDLGARYIFKLAEGAEARRPDARVIRPQLDLFIRSLDRGLIIGLLLLRRAFGFRVGILVAPATLYHPLRRARLRKQAQHFALRPAPVFLVAGHLVARMQGRQPLFGVEVLRAQPLQIFGDLLANLRMFGHGFELEFERPEIIVVVDVVRVCRRIQPGAQFPRKFAYQLLVVAPRQELERASRFRALRHPPLQILPRFRGVAEIGVSVDRERAHGVRPSGC